MAHPHPLSLTPHHPLPQAPKEGEREASKKPVAKWAPSRENYLNFLVESRAVYEALEGAVRDGGHPEYARFADTGLERSAALAQDIAWFEAEYGLKAPALSATGPGAVYAAKIRELAKSDPPAFICHFYNFYFAHTAGGRMIGSQMSKMLLGGRELAFYQWQGDVAVHLDKVRGSINGLAESWTDSQKAHCLQETEASFTYSGKLLGLIGGSE